MANMPFNAIREKKSRENFQIYSLYELLYFSTDFGANFEDVTDKYDIRETIRKHNGLQRHPYDSKKVIQLTFSYFTS